MKTFYLYIVAVTLLSLSLNGYAVDKGVFSKSQICKAAIAEIMGKDPTIIKINRSSGRVIRLSYVRLVDHKRWKYRCKIEGNRIIWATDTGRWRTHSMDDKINFKVSGKSVTITLTHYDGSISSDSFSLNQLGR